MSASTFPPTAPVSAIPSAFPGQRRIHRPSGATAATGAEHPHRLGDALRVLKVFTATAFSVVVLGGADGMEEAGVRRR
ncbi:hypothetical protein [Streptomyces sp. NPDC050560]|uniref:hypothetical protein n=1 Tax=Streptomyces sp. NPDC050560 TaxID=3365630 RepID=UPI0037A572C6